MPPTNTVNQLSLVPLGAGDLIDRAVRLYRRYFITLIRIAAPPVMVTTIGSLLWTVGGHSSRYAASTVLFVLIGALLWIGGALLNIMVMGGAARNLITHLYYDEPFTARTTYRNVGAKFGGLLGTAVVTGLWIGLAFILAILVLALVQVMLVSSMGMGVAVNWASTLVWTIAILIGALLALFVFFFLVKFIIYAPQVYMIEGRKVFDSIGRSFNLARGNLRRLMAMFIFYWFATWSALMILLVPLLWYGTAQGVDVSLWRADRWPMWYAIGYSVMGQLSSILLVPVWMLGLSLIYVDERVRQEGYDIELVASRQLADPSLSQPNRAFTHARQATTSSYRFAPDRHS